MDDVAQYFSKLGQGDRLKSLDDLKTNLAKLIQFHPPVSLIQKFWFATRAASRLPEVNSTSQSRMTIEANRFLYKEIAKLETVIDDPLVTIFDLEKLLNSYTRLQAVPSTIMMAKIINLTQEKITDASAKCLERLALEFTDLGIYPGDEWMEHWWEAAKPKSSEWGLKEGYSVLYRVTLLDFLRSEDPTIDQTSQSPCRQIANSFFGFIGKNARHIFPDNMDSKVYFSAKWFGLDFINDFSIQAETLRSSRSEEVFAQAFAGTNIVVNTDGIIVPHIGHKIDFELVNGKSHGAELDGVLHFKRATESGSCEDVVSFNTSTRFQSWLMANLCPDLHILRVPYFYCDGAERHRPWEETLELLGEKEPGVYAYHGNIETRNIADESGYLYKGQTL